MCELAHKYRAARSRPALSTRRTIAPAGCGRGPNSKRTRRACRCRTGTLGAADGRSEPRPRPHPGLPRARVRTSPSPALPVRTTGDTTCLHPSASSSTSSSSSSSSRRPTRRAGSSSCCCGVGLRAGGAWRARQRLLARGLARARRSVWGLVKSP
eukprot:scaffold1782_cov414-Prasinococcus_capsulatus_cf.AAC.24